MEDTSGQEYTDRLAGLADARWKQVLSVQAPYRWNIRRLHPGHTLDVGCGIGRNLAHLDDAVGVDHNPTSIKVARERGLRAWSSEEWPTCPDAVEGSYDTILMAHLLEHLDTETADEVVRSYLPYLRPDGRLIMICPQERGYATDPTHVRFLDLTALRATARRLGFVSERSFSFPFARVVGKVFPYNEFVVVARRVPT
jgi:2-polyprenyl-3-methyl-5-hydroxy-6-metoxy-1,4-benzoquinol methylase